MTWDAIARAQVVEALERDRWMLPCPTGGPRSRPREFAVDGPAWGAEYLEAVADAERCAADLAAVNDNASDEFRRRVFESFSRHPRFAEWDALATAARRHYRAANPLRRTAALTAVETRRRVEQLSREMGHDITGTAYHLDELTPAGRASYWRRLYNRSGSEFARRKMLEVGRELRARKVGPVRLHRAG